MSQQLFELLKMDAIHALVETIFEQPLQCSVLTRPL